MFNVRAQGPGGGCLTATALNESLSILAPGFWLLAHRGRLLRLSCQDVLGRVGFVCRLGLMFLAVMSVSASLPAAWAETGPDPLNFLLLPTENEASTYSRFLPVKRYLEEQTGRSVSLRLRQTFELARKEIDEGRADLVFLDPSAYCEMKHKLDLRPLVKMVRNGEEEFRSALVVRSDAPFRKIAGIREARLALGRPGSSSSYLIPRAMLTEVGFGLESFSRVGSLQNEDQIALSVLVGDFDVGAMSEEVARKYEDYGLRILKLSERIPQFVIGASAKMAPALASRIQDLLLAYSPEEFGSLGFVRVEDREYNIVRIMLKNMTGQDYLAYPEDAVKVGLLPLYSSITLFKRFSPLADVLSQRTGHEVRLVIPRDFEEFVRVVRSNGVDFCYQNPYVYLLLAREKLVRPLALTVSREPDRARDEFRGVVVVRNDSSIQGLDDLRGKEVMIVSHKSAGGYWFQKLLLQSRGMDIDSMASISEGKRHEEVILGVYRGEADAGFVREAALDVVQDMINMDRIRVLARTPFYPNWPFSAHSRTRSDLASQVQQALISLDHEAPALNRAQIQGFTPPDLEELRNLEALVEFE